MSNQSIYIPSGGTGEIESVPEEKNWYKAEAAKFNEDKAWPFIKLITDLVGVISKCHRNQTRMGRYENYPPLAKYILKTASELACGFVKIKEFSDDLFCTGDIQTIDYCLEVYRQYTTGEAFDYFLWNGW